MKNKPRVQKIAISVQKNQKEKRRISYREINSFRVKTEGAEPDPKASGVKELQADIIDLYLNENSLINCLKSKCQKLKLQEMERLADQPCNFTEILEKDRLFLLRKIKDSGLRIEEVLYLTHFLKSKTFENDIKITKILNEIFEETTIHGGLRTFLKAVENSKKFSKARKNLEKETEHLDSFRLKISDSVQLGRGRRKISRRFSLARVLSTRRTFSTSRSLSKYRKGKKDVKGKAKLPTLPSLKPRQKLKKYDLKVKEIKDRMMARKEASPLRNLRSSRFYLGKFDRSIKKIKGSSKNWVP